MLDGLEQLKELQELDDELARLRKEQAGVPDRRAALAAAREEAEAAVARAAEAVHAAEAGQRQAETEMQDQEALVAKLEGQQSQVKTNEAYTALLHEIDAAREAISGCETRILEAMEVIETAREEQGAADAERDRTRERLGADEKALDARAAELEARLTELGSEREARCASIEPEQLAQYERIAARHGKAVASVSHDTCQGCRMNVPAQLQIELLRGEKLITCGHCHRILIPDATAAK